MTGTWNTLDELVETTVTSEHGLRLAEMFARSAMLKRSGLPNQEIVDMLLIRVEESMRRAADEYDELDEQECKALQRDAVDAAKICIDSAANDLWRSAQLLTMPVDHIDPQHVVLVALKKGLTGAEA